jgi:hypothetical protein
MTSSRKKPGAAFLATVVVVSLMLYVAGYGPWHYARGRWGRARAVTISRYAFMPIQLGIDNGPEWLTEPYCGYLLWCFLRGQRD